MSLVDGTAFFDCGADLSAYAGLDTGSHEYLIKVYDDDGNAIQGYVGAVGGGETLGVEKVTNGTFDANIDGWGGGVASFNTAEWQAPGVAHLIKSVAEGFSLFSSPDDIGITAGTLYHVGCDYNVTSGEIRKIRLRQGSGSGSAYAEVVDTSGVGTSSAYFVGEVTENLVAQLYYFGITGECTVDNYTVKPLTDCAATGFHIISAQGGSTQNWQYEHPDINMNDPNGYGYKLYRIAI